MSVFLIVFGLFFCWVGVNNWRESREHFTRGKKTEAAIVAVEETGIWGDHGWKKAYQAIYAYRDEDGNEHRMRGRRKSTRKGSFPIGERKTVFYNPDDPREVEDSPSAVFSGLTVVLIAGVGLVAFGTAAFLLDWDL